VREFVNKRAELFGFTLSGEDGDSASIAHPQGGSNVLLELKLDALGEDEID
jgi:hypothetical protein